MLEALKGLPTPQGAKKRPRTAGGAGDKEETNEMKTIERALSLLLMKDRDTSSRIGTTILCPPDHPPNMTCILLEICCSNAGKGHTH